MRVWLKLTPVRGLLHKSVDRLVWILIIRLEKMKMITRMISLRMLILKILTNNKIKKMTLKDNLKQQEIVQELWRLQKNSKIFLVKF